MLPEFRQDHSDNAKAKRQSKLNNSQENAQAGARTLRFTAILSPYSCLVVVSPQAVTSRRRRHNMCRISLPTDMQFALGLHSPSTIEADQLVSTTPTMPNALRMGSLTAQHRHGRAVRPFLSSFFIFGQAKPHGTGEKKLTANRRRRQDLPTPESPMRTSLKR